MTCKQLGGACDMKFSAETFDEMAQKSKNHGTQMAEKQDEVHLKAMEDMTGLMSDPQAMEKWMADKRKEFDALPVD